MRRLTISLAASILFALACFAATTFAQESQTFSDEKVNYTLELPSATWRVVSRPDDVSQRAEFIYGDRLDGYLQVHKELVEAGVKPSDLASTDKDSKLRFKPGYIDGKQENFSGRLSGVTLSYEYTSSGKPMVGRIYYLQADNRTIYVLHFTGLRDKLARIRNQTDLIARSFKVK
ncbi:MAG: hypothetical protein JOZ52_07620 [Acidobacteria bacterium]|nr:hypothetical protein [Acidobacteriota bacterium]